MTSYSMTSRSVIAVFPFRLMFRQTGHYIGLAGLQVPVLPIRNSSPSIGLFYSVWTAPDMSFQVKIFAIPDKLSPYGVLGINWMDATFCIFPARFAGASAGRQSCRAGSPFYGPL